MRFTTNTLLIAATVATLATVQPGTALADQAPMTPDEKREKSRLLDAKRAARIQRRAKVWATYAENCEAAFADGRPMPEKDLRITEELVVGDDLLKMTSEELSEQMGLGSDAFRAAGAAIVDCERKYAKKRKDGS